MHLKGKIYMTGPSVTFARFISLIFLVETEPKNQKKINKNMIGWFCFKRTEVIE